MKKASNQNTNQDLTNLTDIFKWNLSAYKELNNFYKKVNDEELKKELMIMSSMHKDICNKIENILK